MTGPNTLTRQAHAKINLALAVDRPRDSDGMHPIASWMAPIDLCDTMTIHRLSDGEPSSFAIDWASDAMRPTPIDWMIDRDLAVRAVRSLEAETGGPLPMVMRIAKRIPVGAGLGGGSSDAAAALLGVREMFELSVTDERLAAIALELGSDVPFFLEDSPALVSGIGEVIERTPVVTGAGAIALFAPPFGCGTALVYRAFDAINHDEFRADLAGRMARQAMIRGADLFNDLAPAAERVEPALVELRARIESAASVRAHITGSGSAIFVSCHDHAEAERVVESARRFVGPIAGVAARFIA